MIKLYHSQQPIWWNTGNEIKPNQAALNKIQFEEATNFNVSWISETEINVIVPTNQTTTLIKIVDDIEHGSEYSAKIDDNPISHYPENIERQQITVGASSYLKIGEGCNYSCGYCIIPKLRGKYVSRPIENIVKE